MPMRKKAAPLIKPGEAPEKNTKYPKVATKIMIVALLALVAAAS